MVQPSHPQIELEAKILDSLQGVPRICNREECGSSNIELKYFDKKKMVGYNQPRFLCKSCQRTFTLGGKVRGEYKKVNKKTTKVKTNTMTTNIQAQGIETSEHNQSKRLDLEKNRSSKRLHTQDLSLVREAASFGIIETHLQEKTQETNYVEETAVPFKIDDCEDANCNSEEANCDLEEGNCGCEEAICNHKDHNILPKNVTQTHLLDVQNTVVDFRVEKGDHAKRQSKTQEDQTGDDFHNIGKALVQNDLLKQSATLHLLNAKVAFRNFQVKKEAMNIDLSCKTFAGESQISGFISKKKQDKIDEDIAGLRNFAEEAAGGLVSPSKYHEMVANEVEMEVMSEVITTMHSKVQEMDVKHVPHSIMLATKEKAKQFRDQVTELAD